MPQQVKKSLVISIYLALAVSALLVFWQVRNFDFVNYDDNDYVYENPHVLNGLTFDNIIWAFTTGHAGNWHPLTWLSLMLDRQLFCAASLPGGPSPAGFHLTNLFFHIANTLLLFLVLKQMTNAIWQSAFVAALFALHPMHVESVAWVAERKDVLSTFFWLLAMLAYVRYVKKPGAARYLLVLLIFALGLMAKPMLVTLPFVLLLLDYWPLERKISWRLLVSAGRLTAEKIPFIVLSIALSVIVFLTQQSSRLVTSFAQFPLNCRIGNAFISYARYIEKMIWPNDMAVFYPHPVENVSVLYAVISAILLLAVTIFIIRFAKLHRYLVTGWFWYLGTLIPVIGIVQVGSQAYADRYTYIPYIGLFIMLAWGLPQILSKLPQRKIALGLSMVIVLTALGICAHRQANYWKNSVTLFSHTIEVTQNNWLAHSNLGNAYARLGRGTEAIDAYRQTIKINPDLPTVHYNLGNVYSKLARYPEAINAYKQAIKIKPDLVEAHYNLGNACYALGRCPEAINAFEQAIKLKPDYADAYYNLGLAYAALGRYAEAIEAYNQVIKIKPNLAELYTNLGVAYGKLGRLAEAIDAFKQAIRIKPDLAEAHNNLGYAYGKLGRSTEAIDAYKNAVRIKPNYAEAHKNLGVAYLAIGDKNSALAEYNILKSLNPQSANDLLSQINK
jgi:tetratricopeptide (TPR) repeat protein